MIFLETQKDAEDFAIGCCFFGTGGGGNADFGYRMLTDALTAGKKIQILDISAIPDEYWIICPYLMGTSGPETDETKQEKMRCGLTQQTVSNMPLAATKLLLSQSPHAQVSAIIPYEIGAAATASAVATAAWLDLPVIDADFVGRAVPEASQMLPAIDGIDLCPAASMDAYGNASIIHHANNRMIFERMGKHLASASFGLIGQSVLLRHAGELKKYMLSGTLSKALAVGKAFRAAQGDYSSLERNLQSIAHSKKIFEGVIADFQGDTHEGYYVGNIIISDKKNNRLKIWFKNENHIAWLNNKPFLTSPDLISIIDSGNVRPVVNNQLKTGMNVTVYGTPAHPKWYEEKNKTENSPRYYSVDIDNVRVFEE